MSQEVDRLERKRKAGREYARRNRKKANAKRVQVNKELVREAKDKPCSICGVKLPPECMHLDHVRGTKLFTIGSWRSSVSTGKLRTEIAKCDVVCPNCHALAHFGTDAPRRVATNLKKMRKEKGRKPIKS